MKDHKAELKSYLSDYKVLGEIAAMNDLDLACQAALVHMRRGDDQAMIGSENLKGLALVARPYYQKALTKALSEIGHFSVKVTMDKRLSDTLWISWV